MSAVDDLTGADYAVLQEAIGGLTDEEYTNARKLSSTDIVWTDPDIDEDTETFTGQLRWRKPLAPTINVASLTDDTDGTTTSQNQDYLTYVKTARTYGSEKINLQKLVTQEDALEKIARDFSETRSQDEHNSILSILKGVAVAEALNGAASAGGGTGLGGQTFDNDPEDAKYGFYVDLGASKLILDATTAIQGAQRAQGFLDAMGKAWKDYEPDYAYLVTSPAVLASLRAANLVDQDRVQDGNVMFESIFNGKLRLIQTRANQSMAAADLTKVNTGAGVDIDGGTTSFIVLPNAIAMNPLTVDEDVEIDRSAAAYQGGGKTQIWYRWGNIYHPAGYDWLGSTAAFPSDAHYGYAVESGTPKAITSVTTIADATGTWGRKATSALSLGILPIFHS